MKEVAPRLYVGSAADYETNVAPNPDGWAVVHACKEPYHREAVGYSGRGAPKDHDEYFFAHREPRRLMLNLVDAPDPAYIPAKVIDEALLFIARHRSAGARVLVHCNQGLSRAPTIAFLHMSRAGLGLDYQDARVAFTRVYPDYAPAAGMEGYAKENWP